MLLFQRFLSNKIQQRKACVGWEKEEEVHLKNEVAQTS